MKEKLLKALHIFLLVLTAFVIAGSFYVSDFFGKTHFEEIMFYSVSNLGDADLSTVIIALKSCLPKLIILIIILLALFYDITFGKIKSKIYPFKHLSKHKWLYSIVLFVLSICLVLNTVGLFDYLYNNIKSSTFINDNYVDPKSKVSFNGEKRNLIMITVESLENGFMSKDHGGGWEYDIIPELYTLLNDEDTVLFNKNYLGMYELHGASYTSSSIVANSTGLPLKIGLDRLGYSDNNFIKGAYALGDLLKDNGYNNEIISGANTSYGGLDFYYKEHGDYNIIDLDRIKSYNYSVTSSDYGRWGFNDKFIFELAKKRLDLLASKEEPFNLQLITIDTHFVDGYIGDYSESKFDKRYENVFATTSRLIYEFVSYIKQQPYYENTTIVIMGDHLAMQTDFINDKMFNNRTVYYCLINPENKYISNNERIFTSLDTYPTVVSAIGGTIDNDRLGLGVNLFSSKKTLAEKYGVSELDTELKRRSEFYNTDILQIR